MFKSMENTYKRLITVMFMASIIACTLFTFVNKVAFNILPEETVEISASDIMENGIQEPFIILLELENQVKGMYSLKDQLAQYNNDENFDLIEKGEKGYGSRALFLKNTQDSIKLKLKKSSRLPIILYNVQILKNVKLAVKDAEREIKIGDSDGGITVVFPFENSKLEIFIIIIIYLLLIIAITAIILLLESLIARSKVYITDSGYTPNKLYIFIYGAIGLYITLKYFTGQMPQSYFIPSESNNYNSAILFGDQSYYWAIGKLIREGNWAGLKTAMLSFRGYITSIIPALSIFISDYTGLPGYYLHYMIYNAIIVFMFVCSIPKLIFEISGKRMGNLNIVIMTSVFVLFWKGNLYSVTFDTLAVFFLISFCTHFYRVLRTGKKKDAILSGLFIGASVITRGNFKVIFFLLVFFLFGLVALQLTRYVKVKVINYSNIILILTGILIICMPQIVYNLSNGNIGLFPYDKVGAWVPGETLTQYHMNIYSKEVFVGWPYVSRDLMTEDMLHSSIGDSRGTIIQIFTAFLQRPVAFVLMMIKKIFNGINIKINEVYPLFGYKTHSFFYIFSLLNYMVYGIFFFVLLNKKARQELLTKQECWLGLGIVITTILPLTIVAHVEWRYYLVLYIMAYYVFAVKFVDTIREGKYKELFSENGFHLFLICFIGLMFWISGYYYF